MLVHPTSSLNYWFVSGWIFFLIPGEPQIEVQRVNKRVYGSQIQTEIYHSEQN